jgi:hypothetical protein
MAMAKVRRGENRSPDQRIVDGIREFYLGHLSKYLPHEAFDGARSDSATEVAMECLRQIRRETAALGVDSPDGEQR